MMLQKGILLIVAMCLTGHSIEAAEQPAYVDHTNGLYPTQIFMDCVEGKYDKVLAAPKEELFRRNNEGNLPLLFALKKDDQRDEVWYQQHHDLRRKLVRSYIELAEDKYKFVRKDLWYVIVETGDVEIVKMALNVAQEVKKSHSWLSNTVSDPVWDLLVSQDAYGHNQIYRAVRQGNTSILDELLQAAQPYGKAEFLARVAFRKALYNKCCSDNEARELNKYMKISRSEMSNILSQYDTYPSKRVLEERLDKICGIN